MAHLFQKHLEQSTFEKDCRKGLWEIAASAELWFGFSISWLCAYM